MEFGTSLFFLVLVVLVSVVCGQDLQFGCITCQDKFDKCEIDCVLVYQGQGAAKITECQSLCASTKATCVDTATALACQDCALSCAVTYDTGLRKCLSVEPREANQDTEYSVCESTASEEMDSCMETCRSTYAK